MKNFAVFSLIFIALSYFAESPPAGNSVFPLSEVKPGLAAKGYSVFKGEEVSVFDVEVIDVQQIGLIKEPMILCRLNGPFFEKNGVIAAMSGSPIYVGDRFLGAVAKGWSFSKDPICALTPAEQMIALYDNKTGGGASLEALSGGSRSFEQFLTAVTLQNIEFKDNLEPLYAQGFSFSSGSGSGQVSSGKAVLPGEMIGVQLVQGDIELTAFGTVSAAKDKRFLAFGHPFLGLGDVDFPVVRAHVSAILPSLMFSFKISGSKEEIGRMVCDSPYGIVAELGKKAGMIPVELVYRKSGGTVEKRNFRIVDDPALSGMLFESSLSLLHEQLQGSSEDICLVLNDLRFDFERGESVKISQQVFGGSTPSEFLVAYIGETLSLLTRNRYKKERIAAVAIDITAVKGRNEGELLEIKVPSSTVFRGDKIEIQASFIPFEGERTIYNISLPSDDLPPGEVKVIVGDNLSVLKRIAPNLDEIPFDFESLKKAVREIPAGGVIVSSILSEQESAYYGSRRLPKLPPSLEAGLPGARETSAARSGEKVLMKPLEGPKAGYFTGLLEVKLNIKERESR
jgi:hypothetical protein